MSLFRLFDISGSALAAQSVRLNVTASNLANGTPKEAALALNYIPYCRGASEALMDEGEPGIQPQEQRRRAGIAEVVDRTYYGHDQLVQLRLDSGTCLQSRLLGSAGEFQPGQRVNLSIQEHAVIYPTQQ